MMSAERADRWAEVRKGGRTRFVVLHGVVGWGLTTALLFSVVMPLINENDTFPELLPTALITFPIGGIAFGWFLWGVLERAYAKSRESSG